MKDPTIIAAAKLLLELDKAKGERTVGERRADARECAEKCGFELQPTTSEHVHPTIQQIINTANALTVHAP